MKPEKHISHLLLLIISTKWLIIKGTNYSKNKRLAVYRKHTPLLKLTQSRKAHFSEGLETINLIYDYSYKPKHLKQM